MKKFLLLLVLALLAMFCYSQNISDYSFSSSTEAFSSIYAIVGGPPSVDWSNGGDDELSASIPIGFSFPFCGSNYTSVKISTNGFITLGTGLTSSYPTNNLAGTYSAPIIAPLWDDLLSWAAWPNVSTTYVMYQNTITNQFKVEWRSVRWNYTGNSTFSQNFQLTLLSTGVIRFNYGSSGTTNNPSASIGINHNGQFISVTPNTSYSSTTANNTITTLPTGRRFSFTPPAPQPNLVIQNLSINPTTAGQGTQITVSYRIKNIGSATASSSDTFIYFDPDNIYGNANATQLYRHTEGSLAPNAYYDRQFSVNIPSTAPTGTRYIWVCADDIFYVNESNEDDNRVYTPITITQSLPDLVIDTYYCSVSPNSASPGSTVTISYRIRNIGSVNAGGSHTYFYFSNDNNINSNDYYLGYVSEPAIAAGGYRDWTKSVTIPTEALSGVRYLGIIADANNSVTESNESNNGGGLQITIIQNPSLSANPTALNFGNVPLYTMPYLSYQLTGSNLTGNVTVSIPSNLPMNISTSQNGTYSTTLTVVPTGGNVNQAIWVRFNPMFAQTYNATINNTSGALSVPVSVTGTGVSPTLAVNPTSLAFGPVTINTNSTPQSYNLTGSNLTANVTVTAPTGYRVATTQNGTYNQSLTVTPSSGSVNTTIWVRFQPTAAQTYNGNVTNASTGATTVNVAVTGQGVNTPTLSVSPPSLAFGQQQINTNSTPQSYNLTGGNLTTSVTVTAPTGYRVATTQNGTYNQSLTVTPSSGSVNTTIWVRFQPTAAQTYNGNVTNASTGATTVNVAVTGQGIQPTSPWLNVNPSSLAFGTVPVNTNSTPQSYALTGGNLTTSVTVTAPTGYRVATTQNGTYNQSLTVTPSSGSVN
ncbi:MAG: CARDB domain-containing protein, partial [Sphaerochaetaceae bacterium]|nr:CARDB domain-containing protein [Sphaerochaetaceae bacterium]